MTLPQVAFNMSSINPFKREDAVGELKWYEKIQFSYNASAENKIKTTDSLFLTNRMFENSKNGFKHSAPLSYNIKITKSINLTPSLTYSGVAYTEYDTYSWSDTKKRIDTINHKGPVYAHSLTPSVSTGYAPKLYGMYMFSNSKVKAIRHMMSPSVGLSFVPDISKFVPNYYYTYKSDTFNHYTRASYYQNNIYGTPTPPPGKSASLDFGLGNNLEMKYTSNTDTSSKEEKIILLRDFSFRTHYNLMADSFNLSNISMSASTSVFSEKLNIQFNSNFDPYKFDTSGSGRRVNSFMIKGFNKPVRMTNASFSLGTSFSSSELSSDNKNNNQSGTTNGEVNPGQIGAEPEKIKNIPSQMNKDQGDYSLPWSLTVNYNWNYNTQFIQKSKKFESEITQSLTFSGNLELTKKWKIGFNSGYDFTAKDLTVTSMNITRDLHCWEMTFSWVPFGPRQSYNFNINARAAILKDLKYNKRNEAWRGRF
jgi:hypothetical protein